MYKINYKQYNFLVIQYKFKYCNFFIKQCNITSSVRFIFLSLLPPHHPHTRGPTRKHAFESILDQQLSIFSSATFVSVFGETSSVYDDERVKYATSFYNNNNISIIQTIVNKQQNFFCLEQSCSKRCQKLERISCRIDF